jgi:translation initiation factor 4G
LDKALNEPAYSALYAQLCQRLDKCVPNFEPPSTPITTFRKLLLTVCQHEFDNRANYYANNINSIATTLNISSRNDTATTQQSSSLSEEEKALIENANQMSKKKMLGNVKFIGELGRLDLLSEAILHKCIKTLLEKQRDEKYADMSSDLECLCKMMPTIGKKLDQGEAVKLMDQYFERMKKLRSMGVNTNIKDGLPQRIRFLLQDCIDLRANNWMPRQTQIDQAPKTMNEVRNNTFNNDDPMLKQPLDGGAMMYGNYLSTNMVGSPHTNLPSSLMMNMLQHFSQQPNMTLLNAINGMATSNKLMSKRNKIESDEGKIDLAATKKHDEISNSQSDLENREMTPNQNDSTNQYSKMEGNISGIN